MSNSGHHTKLDAIVQNYNYAITVFLMVSGLYIGHPASFYFGVGKIGVDQLEDYADRKGFTADEAAMWLSPNLVPADTVGA